MAVPTLVATSPAQPQLAATPVPCVDGDAPRAELIVPRARLVHLRVLGTTEEVRMPDGRLLMTSYKGELGSPGDLPRRGANLGGMWYTRQDGHAWVLAPISTGSGSVGWVDP
jgi:hypothetical protein